MCWIIDKKEVELCMNLSLIWFSYLVIVILLESNAIRLNEIRANEFNQNEKFF